MEYDGPLTTELLPICTSVLVDNGDGGSIPGIVAGYGTTSNADGEITLHVLVELVHPTWLLTDPEAVITVSIIGVHPDNIREV